MRKEKENSNCIIYLKFMQAEHKSTLSILFFFFFCTYYFIFILRCADDEDNNNKMVMMVTKLDSM